MDIFPKLIVYRKDIWISIFTKILHLIFIKSLDPTFEQKMKCIWALSTLILNELFFQNFETSWYTESYHYAIWSLVYLTLPT